MIKELRFRRGTGKFLGSTIVRFEPGVNLLVGPNGSGKSTVLVSAEAASKEPKTHAIKLTKKVKARRFDSEQMNPRTVNFMDAMGDPTMFALAWRGKSKSHGQALVPILTTMMDGEIQKQLKARRTGESITMMLDEPESGLDHDALKEFVKVVNKYRKKVQFIIATHSVWLWKNLDANIIVLGHEKGYAKRVMREHEEAMRAV